jgi:predicted small lipoprotein YifL
MPKSIVSIAMLCLAFTVISACGTKGPLYIPEQRYPQKDNPQKAPQKPSPEAPSPAKTY